MTETDLKKHIESGSLSGLYVIAGEEKYLVRRYAKKLMRKACAGDPFPAFNFQRFDGGDPVDDIAAAVEALPFMSGKKCVAVSDLSPDSLRAAENAKWQELAANVPETTVLLVYQPNVTPEKKAPKWKAFMKLAEKYGKTAEFPRREGAELEKWLCAEAAKRRCELSRRGARKMTELCGFDMQTLHNEMEKLCAYVGQGEITEAVLEAAVSRQTEATVFMLSRALAGGEYNRAYLLLDQMFYQNEEATSILAVLSSAFIDMYRVRAAMESGSPVTGLVKSFPGDYKGREFRIRNGERDVKRLSTEQLRKILSQLLQTDLALKGSHTDSRVLLEELVARIMLITAAKGSRN